MVIKALRIKKPVFMKASTVVEAAYLFPLIMIVWMLILFALFYYHDKNILAGAAYETVVVGSELAHEAEEIPAGKLNQYFQERIQGKLIFFSGASITINSGKDNLEITAYSKARRMSVSVRKSAAITEPEKTIRKFRIAKQRLEGLAE